MKKNIILLGAVVTIISISACAQVNGKESTTKKEIAASTQSNIVSFNDLAKVSFDGEKIYENFGFDYRTRFKEITKSDIQKATKIEDFFDADDLERIVELKSVTITQIKADKRTNIRIEGTTRNFNEEQLEFFRSSDYSTNFAIRLEFSELESYTGNLKEGWSNPHWTIIPEKQAVFENGKDALISYLKENTLEVRKGVNPDKLRPAIMYFTVSKEGIVTKIKSTNNPSGNIKIDTKMVELIKNLPGIWSAAENSKGEKVEQELVVIYGMSGC